MVRGRWWQGERLDEVRGKVKEGKVRGGWRKVGVAGVG